MNDYFPEYVFRCIKFVGLHLNFDRSVLNWTFVTLTPQPLISTLHWKLNSQSSPFSILVAAVAISNHSSVYGMLCHISCNLTFHRIFCNQKRLATNRIAWRETIEESMMCILSSFVLSSSSESFFILRKIFIEFFFLASFYNSQYNALPQSQR